MPFCDSPTCVQGRKEGREQYEFSAQFHSKMSGHFARSFCLAATLSDCLTAGSMFQDVPSEEFTTSLIFSASFSLISSLHQEQLHNLQF